MVENIQDESSSKEITETTEVFEINGKKVSLETLIKTFKK